MANAQVEKLKALGLRHGEKALVTLAGVLCLLFLVRAATKETISLTPDQVAAAAKQAESALSAHQEPDDILKLVEDQGIKNPDFVKLVDAQSKEALNPLAFKSARPWITPEPGAGLIRDTPVLIAATDLYAWPGRGGASIFALDKENNRILEEEKKAPDAGTTARRKKKHRRGGGSGMMGGMMGGMMSGMSGMGGMGGPPPDSPAAKKAAAEAKKKIDRAVVGKAAPAEDKDADKSKTAATSVKEGPFKETTKGLRWVALTGVLDHEKIQENYLAALKNPAIAKPNYKQLDVERQSLGTDGVWSDWEEVDADKNRLITYNLPEEEEELTPDDVRIDTLVDPLPFLKAGFWERVHVASLVPKEKLEVKTPATGGMGGMMGGMPGMEGGMMGGSGSGSAPPSMPGMSGMMGGMPGMEGGMMGGMSGSAGGGEENTNFQKTEAKTIMLRSLDFTVDPDTTYRFRVRIVVYNPNYKREDVSPGTEVATKELKGPWSEPTNAVTMPADVAAYAMDKTRSGPGSKRTDQVSFQIVRWTQEDGVTVTSTFDAGPGEVVGEPKNTQIPYSEGEKSKTRLVDYNSHQMVLDTSGGLKPIAQVGATGAPLDVPATTLLMRSDGTILVRNESFDQPDAVRKDMAETYKRELTESGKLRESSQGRNSSGSRGRKMGGMGGMGGMDGGMRGGGRR